ncbi:MAG TPA: GMC family oxidoreductase [Blastocatellia bacterium]|nr:GMC family oxidoreductase [Blastocatellia bacterium]
MADQHYTAVVIGTGFGGSMTAIPLAKEFMDRKQGETLLMIERGTWWTTPVSTVQDKEVKTRDFLARKGQPVQFWSSLNHFRGFIDLFTRCFRRKKNEDGLFDILRPGKPGLLGIFGGQNDGVSIVRANGVGGGSLVYSNITIRPPDLIFDDPRWPTTWTPQQRNDYYELARHAIGYGISSALQAHKDNRIPFKGIDLPLLNVNSGLSNIVARTARLDPHLDVKPDPNNSRGIKQIHLDPGMLPGKPLPPVSTNRYWLDRARVFQTAVSQLTNDFGTVDLAIADITSENAPIGPNEIPPNYPPKPPSNPPANPARNYCERQGRCNVGCLPGARHTLNKQLMRAIFGGFNATDPDNPKSDTNPEFPNMSLETLSEVDVIRALPGGGYEIQYIQRKDGDLSNITRKIVTADIVIVAAGCVGTTEIMLRSKQRGTLPNLSDKVGFGFSTNGDYIAFLEKTQERVSLIRGPVTTSYGHFNTTDAGTGGNPAAFHTLEDQGIPPALASLLGQGVPLIHSLGKGNQGRLFVLHAILRYLWKRLVQSVRAFFTNYRERDDIFRSEEEIAANMMCVVGMGREESVGQFRLGKSGESSLRLSRADGKKFYDDPIYGEIRKSLARLAQVIRDPADPTSEFINPFLTNTAGAFDATSIAVSHPLGGCVMGKDASQGTVDEFGRVFDTSKTGARSFYEKLYIADASVIPTALGVNPSLTIATLALRIADNIIQEL